MSTAREALEARLAASVVTGENRDAKIAERRGQAATLVAEPLADDPAVVQADGDNPDADKRTSGEAARLRKQRAELRARLDTAERENKELRARLTPPSQDDPRPKVEDFGGDAEKYADAVADWKLRQTRKVDEAAELARRINARAQELAEEYPDFEEVIKLGDQMKGTPALLTALRDCGENVPDIQYYLCKHPEELERINGYTENGASRAFGAILRELELERDKTPIKDDLPDITRSAKLTSVSKAPPPITPIRSPKTGLSELVNDKGEVTDGRAYREQRRNEIAARVGRR